MTGLSFVWTPNSGFGLTDTFDIGVEDTSRNKLLFGQFSGFSGADTDDYTGKSAYQNGQTFYAQHATERSISFSFRVTGDSYNDLNLRKAEISQYFAPIMGEGTLRVNFPDGRTYDINAVPFGAPIFNDRAANAKHATNCTIFLTAYNPFWFDPSADSYSIAVFDGGFTLPFTIPFALGMTGMATLTNTGHVPAPVTITVPGPTTNPVIENERTGEKISVTKTLLADEYLTISTSFDNPLVTYTDASGNSSSLLSAVSADSEFWSLQPGDNIISLIDTTARGSNPVVIEWYNQYWGIL